MKVIDRTKAETQYFLEKSFKNLQKKENKERIIRKTQITVIVPLNMTYLHCLQHAFFENLFNLY